MLRAVAFATVPWAPALLAGALVHSPALTCLAHKLGGVKVVDVATLTPRDSWTTTSFGAHAFFASAAQPAQKAEEDAVPDKQKLEDDRSTYQKGFVAPHPGLMAQAAANDYMLMHPVYTSSYVESVKPKHLPSERVHQKLGLLGVTMLRKTFDWATGYGPNMDEKKWLRRIIFLETIAGVPGMVSGMLRHMKSLRSLDRDNGWIHTLLEEAENERMHLLTFMQMRKPGPLFRAMVIVSQGIFFNAYLLAYLIHPPSCHAFVGYLEEEAVKTYTHAIKDLDEGKIPEWTTRLAPPIAVSYWKLPEGATMRDLLLAVRADEACHSHVNHTFSLMKPTDSNPFSTNSHMVP